MFLNYVIVNGSLVMPQLVPLRLLKYMKPYVPTVSLISFNLTYVCRLPRRKLLKRKNRLNASACPVAAREEEGTGKISPKPMDGPSTQRVPRLGLVICLNSAESTRCNRQPRLDLAACLPERRKSSENRSQGRIPAPTCFPCWSLLRKKVIC